MRTIRLASIEMHNFKGEENRKTVFIDGLLTTICGDNGLGKSRHFDAFTWCLWGKDSLDRKDFEVQSRDENGDIIHHVTTSVEVIINVTEDGKTEEYKFTRKLDENWVKPRGAEEAKLKNRVTSCLINDVPMTVSEYGVRINKILADDTCKLVSNPLYFATILDWKSRRKLILDIVGTKSDEELAQGNEALQELLERMGDKDANDFKREVNAKRLATKKELDAIQPRIDQTTLLMPKDEDWSSLEQELAEVTERIEKIDDELSSAKTFANDEMARRNAILGQIEALKRTQMDIRVRMEADAKKKEIEANSANDVNIAELRKVENDLRETEEKVTSCEKGLETGAERMRAFNTQLEELRKKWIEENEKDSTDYVCPSCGQALPEDKANETKIAVKAQISKQGKDIKALADMLSKNLGDTEIEREKAVLNRNMLKKRADELTKAIAEFKTVHIEVKPEETASWITAQFEIDKLQESLTDVKEADNSALKADREELNGRRDSLLASLKNKALISEYTKVIEELKDKARELVSIIANCQKYEDSIAELMRTRVDECEGRINALFEHVSFKMFHYTLDGVQEDCCTILVDGVPFEAANSTGRINAGLEILNVLAKFYGVNAPVWIDNAESYNHINETEGQQIQLKVTNDKEIVVA